MAISTLPITPELLIDLLHLPDNTIILDARVETYSNGDVKTVLLRVDHPDIPDGFETVNASFRRQEPIVFEGWKE